MSVYGKCTGSVEPDVVVLDNFIDDSSVIGGISPTIIPGATITFIGESPGPKPGGL